IARIHTEKVDYLRGLTLAQKRKHLAKTSYADYLTQAAKLAKDALPFFQTRTHDLFGLGIDAVPALDCYESGDDYGVAYPGFQGLGLRGAGEAEEAEPYIFHFPDGNASIARLLVRQLVPGVLAGKTMDDIVL